jgi:A/G-specific adenine glycosylase
VEHSPVDVWQQLVQSSDFQPRISQFQTALVKWFEENGRELPWRNTHDPYMILVSELMLQQTQVERVLEFWPRFLGRFPTLQSVAEATEEEVIKYWEGLGYYNRARNLLKLAQEVLVRYEGKFPTTKKEILALPGIGEYTAGAVMSFALKQRAPIVDTNVDRVYSRVFLTKCPKDALPVTNTQREKILWLLAEVLTPQEKFWEYNQGIMDLGATICKPEKPQCGSCPIHGVKGLCSYYSNQSLSRFF